MSDFKSEVRDGMRIDWDVPITMDDGARAARGCVPPGRGGQVPGARELRPVRQGARVPGRLQDRLGDHGAREPRRGRRHQQPVPELGSGRSRRSGCRTATSACASIRAAPAARPATSSHNNARENRDFHDCIEWAAAQPWCSGKVGLNGISYYASNQWRAAALQPPHLAAICVWEGWVGQLPRLGAPRRHHLHLPQELAGHAGEDRAARRGRARRRRAASPASWCAGRRR